jgi:threonine dehydrogenase-like Zn-dependent dehydrogenase
VSEQGWPTTGQQAEVAVAVAAGTTVRYAVASEAGVLELRTVERESLPLGHVRVKVAFVGICHSDTAMVREGQGSLPTRLGHEVSGTIIESRVDGLAAGTEVAAYVSDGYATEIVVPVERVVRLDPGCSLLDAALSEPLACVIGGIEMLDLAHEPEVVLVGAGFMGLMAVRVLAARGLRVTVIEPRDLARQRALELGAARTMDPSAVPASLMEQCPVVVEATGGAAGLELAASLVKIGGTLGIMGYHQSNGGQRTVKMESWNFRALRVLSLHHRDPADVMLWMDRAQRLSSLGILSPSALADAFVSLDELPALFAANRGAGEIKTVLRLVDGEG